MFGASETELLIYAAAALLAAFALINLMRQRRDQIVGELQTRADQEKANQAAQAKRKPKIKSNRAT